MDLGVLGSSAQRKTVQVISCSVDRWRQLQGSHNSLSRRGLGVVSNGFQLRLFFESTLARS